MKFLLKVVSSWLVFKLMDILLIKGLARLGNWYLKQDDISPDVAAQFKSWKKKNNL